MTAFRKFSSALACNGMPNQFYLNGNSSGKGDAQQRIGTGSGLRGHPEVAERGFTNRDFRASPKYSCLCGLHRAAERGKEGQRIGCLMFFMASDMPRYSAGLYVDFGTIRPFVSKKTFPDGEITLLRI